MNQSSLRKKSTLHTMRNVVIGIFMFKMVVTPSFVKSLDSVCLPDFNQIIFRCKITCPVSVK